MQPPLPNFRFHPDPVQSGCVERSDTTCRACGTARGWIYTGPCYGESDLAGQLCPWCLADGTAHAKFGTTFQDVWLPDQTDEEARTEIEERTPGITSFNPVHWPLCCGMPMGYLEPAGIAEIRARHRELEGQLMATIVHELHVAGSAAQRLLESLRRDESPCVHVFRCLSCAVLRGAIDFV